MLEFIGVVCIIVGYFAGIITMASVSSDSYKKGYEDGRKSKH